MARETTDEGGFAQAWRRDGLAMFGAPLLAFVLVALVLPLLGVLLADWTLSAIEIFGQPLLVAPAPDVSFDYPHHFFLGALAGILPLCNVGVYWLALLRLRRGVRWRSAWRATAGLLTLFCTATFWLLGEEVAFTVQRFGPGYRILSWADTGWMSDTIAQEPAIMLVGALCIIALSGGTLACAALVSRRWRATPSLSAAPRDGTIPTLVLDMGLIFSVTTLLVIVQDLLASQINFTAINFDPQTGQPTPFGLLISAALFLALPMALMVGATWHARRQWPRPDSEHRGVANDG